MGLFARPIDRASRSINIDQSESLGRVVQVILVSTAVMVAVQQLGLDVSFLTTLLMVVIGVLLAGIAMAFALGARTFFANLVGAHALRQHCRPGEYLQIGAVSGVIAEISQTVVFLDSQQGRISIPACLLQEQVSVFGSETSAEKAAESVSAQRSAEGREHG